MERRADPLQSFARRGHVQRQAQQAQALATEPQQVRRGGEATRTTIDSHVVGLHALDLSLDADERSAARQVRGIVAP